MDNTKAFNGTDHLEALLDDLRASAFQAGGNGDDGSEAVFKASDALREFFAELAASLPESPIRQQLITKRELEQFAHNGRLADRIQTTDAKLAEATTAKDAAYRERNQLVALLARLYPSGIAQTPIEGWDPAWHGCVYIDLPTGQASWHFHTSEAHLFADLPPYAGSWDGHTTEEKYQRVAALAAQQAAPQAEQQHDEGAAEAGYKAAAGHLAALVDEAHRILADLHQYAIDLQEDTLGGRSERGEVPIMDLAEDWLAARPDLEPQQTQQAAPKASQGPAPVDGPAITERGRHHVAGLRSIREHHELSGDELTALTVAIAVMGNPPAIPCNEELERVAEGHQGHPADFAADVLQRWGGWQPGLLGYGGKLNANLAPAVGVEPVAKVVSWTNGSYWRNYKLAWMDGSDYLDTGALLYATPPDHTAAMRQALDVLEHLQGGCTDSDDGTVEVITVWCPEVIDALRAALGETNPPVQGSQP